MSKDNDLIDELINDPGFDKRYIYIFRMIKKQLDKIKRNEREMLLEIDKLNESNRKMKIEWEEIQIKLKMGLSALSYDDLLKKRNEMYEAIISVNERVSRDTARLDSLAIYLGFSPSRFCED